MNWIGIFKIPGNHLLSAIIRFIIIIHCIISGNLCFAQVSQDKQILRINELRDSIFTYDDFENVRRMGEEIIRLSKLITRPDYELEAVYNLCWSADYHSKIQDFQYYLQLGNQLMIRYANELKTLDLNGYHRASMLLSGGMYYYALGNYDQAIEEFSKILLTDGKPVTRDTSLLYSCYNYIGQSYFVSGHLDKAMQYFELANRYISNDQDFDYFHALYYMYQAQYQYSVDKVQDAFLSLHQALPLLLKDQRKAFARNSLKSNYLLNASFYQRMNEYDSAMSYAKKNMELLKNNDPDYINTFRLIGDIFYLKHDLDSALNYYTKSLDLSNKIYNGKHYYKARSLMGISNIWRDWGNFSKADLLYKESLNNLEAEGRFPATGHLSLDNLSSLILPHEGMRVMIEQAKLFYTWYKNSANSKLLDSCIMTLENALFLNDVSRRELMNVETKESKALLQAEITGLGVEVSSKAFEISRNNSYLGKAFYFMEKSKGNILMDRIDELRARNYAGIPKPVLDKELQVKGELSINKTQLLKLKITDSLYNETKSQYDDKSREYTALISELETKYPRYYQLKYDTKTVPIEEVQKFLPSNHSILLQYYIGSNRIFIVGITKKQVIIKTIPRSETFDQNLESILKQIANPDILEKANDPDLFNEFIRKSRYLYVKLLYPVLSEVKSTIRELIIIPDGYLCYLPFEILLVKDSHSVIPAYSALPYLLKEYQVRYDYSASLIVGNSDSKIGRKDSYIGYAPSYHYTVENYNALLHFNPSSLYANRDEIESCRKIWQGVSYLDNKATETSFRKLSATMSILHLAAHSFINDADPQNSCFVLYQDGLHDQDGLLFTNELYDMSIPAHLVILSGCETGIGNFKKGEGIISLARAFKFAGCQNIIMSLWKVNDKATKEIMIAFNKNLKKGMQKDRALQLAKITYLKNSANIHPAFWSSFVLIGNDNPLSNNRNRTILYLGIAGCLIILVIIFTIKRYPFKH